MAKKTNKTARYVGILARYLEKLGVKTSLELSPEEQATYNKWTELLTEELTLDTLLTFMRGQLAEQNHTLRDAVRDGKDREAQLAVARIENYESLISLVEGREKSRDELAEHIRQLTETTL